MNKRDVNLNPKTLAMIKMEKNFIAHIKKKYPRKPYMHSSLMFFLKRLGEEIKELRKAISIQDWEGAKVECGDVSNILDFIFERLTIVSSHQEQAYVKALEKEIDDNRAMKTIRKLENGKDK